MLHLDDGITLEPEDISPKPNAAPLAPSAARPIRDGVLLSARPVHQPRPSKPRPELQMERGIPCIPPTAVTGRPVRWDSGRSCESYETEGTSSEIGRTFLQGGCEAGALTLSEVPGVHRLAAGRVAPHYPMAASSIGSSMGTAATEANVHLHCTEEIEQRYSLPFEAAAVTIYAPIPQFRAGLEQAGCAEGVLSEAGRAKLLVTVGGDGRLVYASTGAPVAPSSPLHDAPCAHMFVALASGALYISANDRVEFHHELAGNAPVVAAGEMFLSDGRLHAINNRSGHYRPPPECLRVVVSLLRTEGALTAVPFKEFHYDAAGDPKVEVPWSACDRPEGDDLQTI